MRVCGDCESEEHDDAVTVASSSGCRRRSRLSATSTTRKRPSVTFDLPEHDTSTDSADSSAIGSEERSSHPNFVCAHDAVFAVPGVDCLGCLLPLSTLQPVVDALHRNAAHLSEEALPAVGLAAYEELRAKCKAEGLLAPEWSAEGIRQHFWHHAYDPVLEASRLARSLDAVQSILLEQIERSCEGSSGGGGSGAMPSLGLLQRVSSAQAKQHAWAQKLQLKACEPHEQQPQTAQRDPTSVGHSGGAKRGTKGSVRRRPCHAESECESGRERAAMVRAAMSAAPKPVDPAPRAMDASVAKEALRDFLRSFVRPCASASAKAPVKVQRTLMETWQNANTVDVLARSRCDELCRYQVERRCACVQRKGSREGCSFAIDRRFEKQLAEFSPELAGHYLSSGLDALLVDLKEALHLPREAKLRTQTDRVVVYGFACKIQK